MATQLFTAFDISRSGLVAERVRMNIIANNIANAMSTRTPEGGPFARQLVVLRGHEAKLDGSGGMGVDVERIQTDPSPFKSVYDPGHPDADPTSGIVLFPNVDIPIEMVDLITASRAYEANVAAISATRRLLERSLEIIRE